MMTAEGPMDRALEKGMFTCRLLMNLLAAALSPLTTRISSQQSIGWHTQLRIPMLLALGMLGVFLLMVAIPWLRAFFSLAALDSRAYALIGGAAILWGLLQRWLWRIHFLERFLALE
ncbi:MAG: hypothetical protein ACJ8BW_29310 [Ktedonobacteraceae bacterium]